MNAFVDNVGNQTTRTENGMKARKSTNSALVDLFFKIGASRGKDIIPSFVGAYKEDKELAVRIALWARDVRGGAGERKLFRDIMSWLEKNDIEMARRVVCSGVIPQVGRWDDLLVFETDVANDAMSIYEFALKNFGDGLAAKWAPRKGPKAVALRKFMSLTPKQYRKLIVGLTNVVETKMCANDWNSIDFEKIPSLASSRYRKAFERNASSSWKKYTDRLSKGEAKVNASAVYPYDVIKSSVNYHWRAYSKSEIDHIVAQWEALPNYVGDSNILPMVDVSGSMTVRAGGMMSLTCLDVATSLGLYCADKASGAFKDTFLTFSSSPKLVTLKGNIIEKLYQMNKSNWAMSTNLHAAFEKVLKHAKEFDVPQEDMPDTIVIFSDMQFDTCSRYDNTAMEMIEKKYRKAGYDVPKIVFWNLNSRDNVPVKFDKNGTALVSGFSPSIMKSILSSTTFDPFSIMKEAIVSDRYNF